MNRFKLIGELFAVLTTAALVFAIYGGSIL